MSEDRIIADSKISMERGQYRLLFTRYTLTNQPLTS